jgi:hypothetical protein
MLLQFSRAKFTCHQARPPSAPPSSMSRPVRSSPAATGARWTSTTPAFLESIFVTLRAGTPPYARTNPARTPPPPPPQQQQQQHLPTSTATLLSPASSPAPLAPPAAAASAACSRQPARRTSPPHFLQLLFPMNRGNFAGMPAAPTTARSAQTPPANPPALQRPSASRSRFQCIFVTSRTLPSFAAFV